MADSTRNPDYTSHGMLVNGFRVLNVKLRLNTLQMKKLFLNSVQSLLGLVRQPTHTLSKSQRVIRIGMWTLLIG